MIRLAGLFVSPHKMSVGQNAPRTAAEPPEDPMIRLLALPALALLAACGADGAPQPPAKPGITISGDAQIGVVSQ
jgi:hypothetical protein